MRYIERQSASDTLGTLLPNSNIVGIELKNCDEGVQLTQACVNFAANALERHHYSVLKTRDFESQNIQLHNAREALRLQQQLLDQLATRPNDTTNITFKPRERYEEAWPGSAGEACRMLGRIVHEQAIALEAPLVLQVN